jgi:WD40 repeat protein/serine/threonine protein kinase
MDAADQIPREKALFEQALDVASSAERFAFLRGACGEDAALLARVQALLQAHEAAEGFLPGQPAGPASFVPVSEKPGDRIGRYKLRERIGEGGCGVVYVAEQEEPVHRKVALKVIKLGMDTRNVVARFQAERQALALMDHPNIAQVHDAGATETGRPYFVMELVRGVKITDYCDQHRLSTRERLELFIKVCQAVQHAHQKGVIHRDLKPSNILVTVNDPGSPGVPKVIDFGIAKATTGRLTDLTVYTDLHQFIGTPAYMSPEQATMTSLDIDTRSDIYSLGVLLYELLTGHTPFDTKELMALEVDALRRTIREKEPMRPSTRLSTMIEGELATTAKHRASAPPSLIHLVRGDLDWIVMKCLEKDRTRRYETANGLAFDLKRHLNNEPVLARPPSTVYRIQKAIRRNKLAFMAGVAVAVALVLGIGISTWQAMVAQQARREAEHQLYAAKMNLAQQAWDQNNIGQLRQLLEDTQDSPYRGFEWYYWDRLTHLALKTLRGHLDAVKSVAFSPDGQRIVTGSEDHTAKVWDVASGRELLTLKGHNGRIWSVAFSPDGQRIVTGSGDNTAKVWDAASGKELLTLKGHTGEVWSVAFSPDGQRIVTGSGDNTAKVWEAASGATLLTLKGHKGKIWSVAFSPDGQRIVTGGEDQTAEVWDAASGNPLLPLRVHNGWILSVAFSPDGQRIVTGCDDQTAKVWDAASGKELLTLRGHSSWIPSVAFSPDGQRIVTGGWDHVAKVWEAASGKPLLTLKGHSGGIWRVAFSPDGQRIVTGSEDQTAKIWEAASSEELLTLKGHTNEIMSVAFSPDGQRIVTGSFDETAKVWEVASGKELLMLKGHSDRIWSVAFSPDGQRIVTGSYDQTAKVWEAASGTNLFTLKGHSAPIWSVAFSPDGQRIVTGSVDQTAKVWEAASGRPLLTLTGHSDEVGSVAFSPDGQRIATGSLDKTAKVWDAASGRELLTLRGHGAAIWPVAFSPDGKKIVTGSHDETAKVWDAASGRELLTLKGHSNWVLGAAFSPDGQRIVTGSDDNTAKVWEAATGRELLTLKGHSGGVMSVAFSPDGQRIVAGSRDHTARVWEAATGQQVAAWQEEERAAAQYLAALERERTAEQERQTAEQERQRLARARNSIKQWLILAPIALAAGQSGAEGLDIEQIEGEGQLRPKAGEARSVGGGELKWREVALTNEVVDFNALLGQETTQSVAYAVCYLRSEAEQRGLQMLVGSDDEAKVYLNGKQVYKSPIPRPFVAEEGKVPDIALNVGLNVLVFKVVNEALDWKGSIRLTDAQGNPVKGIKATLDREAKDAP